MGSNQTVPSYNTIFNNINNSLYSGGENGLNLIYSHSFSPLTNFTTSFSIDSTIIPNLHLLQGTKDKKIGNFDFSFKHEFDGLILNSSISNDNTNLKATLPIYNQFYSSLILNLIPNFDIGLTNYFESNYLSTELNLLTNDNFSDVNISSNLLFNLNNWSGLGFSFNGSPINGINNYNYLIYLQNSNLFFGTAFLPYQRTISFNYSPLPFINLGTMHLTDFNSKKKILIFGYKMFFENSQASASISTNNVVCGKIDKNFNNKFHTSFSISMNNFTYEYTIGFSIQIIK